ncbi:hypothetical protein J7J84_06875 [bacterium]|nr:hypothetical protein [bacterium]
MVIRRLEFLLLACILMLAQPAVRTLADETGGSIELPGYFPPMEDRFDPDAPFAIQPANPDLVQGPDYQPLGLNLQRELLSPEMLRDADSFGFSCYRLTVKQADFADPGSPNLFVLADIVKRIRNMDCDVLLTLDSAGLDIDAYMGFFAAVDAAVGGMVRYYQVLDNINRHLGVSSYTYHELIKRVREYRDETEGGFEIVCGGVQGVDREFIADLVDAYVFDRVDAISFNLYPDPAHMEFAAPPQEITPHSLYDAVVTFSNLRRFGKPFFVTSLGVSNAYAPLGVSQLDQASMVARSILYLLNGGASRIFLHSFTDTDQNYLNPLQCMGLYACDGTAKPVAGVVRHLSQILRGSYPFTPYYLFQMSNNFPAARDPVYVQHFYHPSDRATYFIYWTSAMKMLDRTTNLALYRTDLRPVALLNLLTGENAPPGHNSAGNLTLFAGLPLSHVPTAIKFIGGQPNG